MNIYVLMSYDIAGEDVIVAAYESESDAEDDRLPHQWIEKVEYHETQGTDD